MVIDLEPAFARNFPLPVFDDFVHEFLDPSALDTDKVIMVSAAVQLKDRGSPFKIVALYQSRSLELGQYTVDGCETDLLTTFNQCTINVFRAHVALVTALQNIEYLDARQGHLETGLTYIAIIHFAMFVGFV